MDHNEHIDQEHLPLLLLMLRSGRSTEKRDRQWFPLFPRTLLGIYIGSADTEPGWGHHQ